MAIKLIAIDIDGTLVDSNRRLSEQVKKTLQKKTKEGVKIVLCSGRPLIGMEEYLHELDLMKENQYTISYNGALVVHNGDKKPIVKHTLTHKDFIKMEQLSRNIEVHFHTQDQNYIYTSNRDISEYTVFESFATQMPLHYCPAEEMKEDIVISKMMMIDKPDILNTAIPQIPQEFFEEYHIVKSQPFFLEILNKKASKGNAIRDLATHLGIRQEETMGIGDNENDIDMLKYTGLSIAMGNATDNAKAHADFITKTNDEDGVAHAIETWA